MPAIDGIYSELNDLQRLRNDPIFSPRERREMDERISVLTEQLIYPPSVTYTVPRSGVTRFGSDGGGSSGGGGLTIGDVQRARGALSSSQAPDPDEWWPQTPQRAAPRVQRNWLTGTPESIFDDLTHNYIVTTGSNNTAIGYNSQVIEEPMSIIQQQDIAKELLDKLRSVDKGCILAGGAPRDWYLGRECRDLDFFLFGSTMFEGRVFAKKLETLNLVLQDVSREDYCNGANGITTVYKTYFKGMPINLMIMNSVEKRDTVVDEFPCSISKFTFEAGSPKPLNDIVKKLTDGKVIVYVEEKWNSPYMQKIKNYFPDASNHWEYVDEPLFNKLMGVLNA